MCYVPLSVRRRGRRRLHAPELSDVNVCTAHSYRTSINLHLNNSYEPCVLVRVRRLMESFHTAHFGNGGGGGREGVSFRVGQTFPSRH